MTAKGKQSRGGLELKTSPEGKCDFDGIPYGVLRVQVLAHGFQTYGEDFDIEKPKTEITIKLKRPQGQFSVYDDRPNDAERCAEAGCARRPIRRTRNRTEIDWNQIPTQSTNHMDYLLKTEPSTYSFARPRARKDDHMGRSVESRGVEEYGAHEAGRPSSHLSHR